MDAVDDLSDAIDVTRNLLLPIRPWLWLKLAIVVFFVGGSGGSGFPSGDPTMTTGEVPTTETPPAAPPEIPTEDLLVILGVVAAVILAVYLFFAILGAIMEFVFIESLRSTEVSILGYGADNLGRGFRLFGFRLFLDLLSLVVVAGPFAYLFVREGSIEATVDAILGASPFRIVLFVLLGVLLAIVYGIVQRFTSEFVAPIMLLESRGVLSAWRRFWPTLAGNWAEYLVYLVLVWILQLVIGFAVLFVIAFAIIALAIPVVILVVLLLALGDVGMVLAIPVVLAAALLALLIVLLVQVPIRSYFQYYALLLLGDTNSNLDLIPEQRAAVRGGGRGGGGNTPGGPVGGDGPDDPGHPDRGWGSGEPDADRNGEAPVWDDDEPDRDERAEGDADRDRGGDPDDRDRTDDRGW